MPRLWLTSPKKSLLLLTKIPSTRKEINKQLDQALSDLDAKMVIRDPSLPLHTHLPPYGLPKDHVYQQLTALGGIDHSKWEQGG